MTTDSERETRTSASNAWAWVWAVAVALSVVALAVWSYRIPSDYVCTWGANAAGAAHFADAFHVNRRPLDPVSFRRGFQICLAAIWLAYLGLLSNGLAGATLPRRRVLALALPTLLALALLGPPALSPDIYAYVGYARLQVWHHLNPYEATQLTLIQLGDPSGRYLHWPLSSPYGPLWTLMSMALVAALPKASLLAPLVAIKLVSAVSVVAMAEAGRRLAERLWPGRGEPVFAAIALNPIFALEGVANGHNDVVMMAFVLWALVAVADGRFLRAFGLVGLAAAIKFFPLMLAPWFFGTAVRETPSGRRLGVAVGAVVLAVSPLLLGFAPFWHGTRTLAGLRLRSLYGQRMAGASDGHGVLVLLGIYVLLSFWVLRGDLRRIVCAWILASYAVMSLVSGIGFPWYIVWPWAAALVLVEGWTLIFPLLLYGGAFTLIVQYAW